jgi:hypothetical protein
MRLLINLFQWILNLPWWQAALVIAALVAAFYGLSLLVRWYFDKVVRETVTNLGAQYRAAQITVHSVTATPAPQEPSPYDAKEDDEDYAEGIDGEPWDDEDANFYLVDVTIALAEPSARWDPTLLALVPADFAPEDPTEVCPRLCALHSAQIFVNDAFKPAAEGDRRGPQRLRMLFAIGDGIREAKFASGVTYFGHVKLPPPLPKGTKLAARS